jgi:hypothetical protein
LDFVTWEGKEHGAIGNSIVAQNEGGSSFIELLLIQTQGVENTT